MTTIAQQVQAVNAKMKLSASLAGRAAGAVQLLAVSKTFGADAVQAAWNAGQRAFGENYVQEAIAKMEALKSLRAAGNFIEWHLVGPLQSNKTAVVAEHFDWVQTIDRLKIAQRLNDQRPAHLAPLNVCIQVNVDGGENKSGLVAQDEGGLRALLALARQIGALERLALRGLLAIPEPESDKAKQQVIFTKVREAFDFLNQSGCKLDTLSMGMSADFEAAIAAGSTMVRVGSAIFGQRPKNA
jgi:PLP dependent protein